MKKYLSDVISNNVSEKKRFKERSRNMLESIKNIDYPKILEKNGPKERIKELCRFLGFSIFENYAFYSIMSGEEIENIIIIFSNEENKNCYYKNELNGLPNNRVILFFDYGNRPLLGIDCKEENGLKVKEINFVYPWLLFEGNDFIGIDGICNLIKELIEDKINFDNLFNLF